MRRLSAPITLARYSSAPRSLSSESPRSRKNAGNSSGSRPNPRFARSIHLGDGFIRAHEGDGAVQHPFVDIGEDKPASRCKPADPAHHATDRVAGKVLAHALPNHDCRTRDIEAGGPKQPIEVIGF